MSWPGRELSEVIDGLQANGGNVSQLFFVSDHVVAEVINYGLRLKILHLPTRGPRHLTGQNHVITTNILSMVKCSPHLTARFCNSPFLSSSNLRSIRTTLLYLLSSRLMESSRNSVIRLLVAMNLKSLSVDVI